MEEMEKGEVAIYYSSTFTVVLYSTDDADKLYFSLQVINILEFGK